MKPPRIFGLYPAGIQSDPKFCDGLAKTPNAQELMGHFNVVVGGDRPGTFKTLPYIPLGSLVQMVAYRKNLTGVFPCPVAAYWNIGKS